MKKGKKLQRKRLKKGFVYGMTAGIFGAAAAGIVVPIAIAATRVHNYNPLPGINGHTDLTGDLSVDQITNALKKAGIQDSTLLNKTEYQTAFYLYGKEQAASINYQKMSFHYAEFQQLDAMVKTLASNYYTYNTVTKKVELVTGNNLKFTPWPGKTIVISNGDGVNRLNFDNLLIDSTGAPIYDNYQKVYDALIQAMNVNGLDVLQKHNDKGGWNQKIDALKSNIKTYQDKWNHSDSGLTKKLAKLDQGLTTQDYDSSNFASWYPQTLKILGDLNGSTGHWSGTGVYGDQAKIFMDARHNFIKGYATREKGEAAWAKQLSTKYNGATTEKDAIDYLVYNSIKDKAFARNKFETNSDYDVDQLISGIYQPIVGGYYDSAFSFKAGSSNLVYTTPGVGQHLSTKFSISEATPYSGTASTTNEFTASWDDKIYFFGTKSKDVSYINMTGNNNLPNVFDNRHMMKVQQAILGFKQGVDNVAGWTITPDILSKLFFVNSVTTSGTKTDLNLDRYENIFKTGSEAETATLIKTASGNSDATKDKSGSLGYMPGLNATTMAEGFGLGMLAAYDDIEHDGTAAKPKWFGSQAIVNAPNLLSQIRDALVNAFVKAANDKGQLTVGGNPFTLADFKPGVDNQKAITNFLTKYLAADDITKYFGVAIKKVFEQNGKGMGQVYRISKSGTSGIYAFYDTQYGLHIVKIDTTPFSGGTAIASEMQKVANKHDPAQADTDYGKLYSDNYATVDQVNYLLTHDTKTGEFHKYLQDHIKDYTPVSGGTNPIAADVEKLVNSLIAAENLDRVQKSGWTKFPQYLIKEFDGKLIDPNLAMDPENIYNAIQKIAGGK